MKRKVAGVLAAAMAAGMLAGCGSSAKPADTTAAKAEDTKAAEGSTEAAAADNGDKITIEFWHCMGSSNGELIQQITDSFNESQDKIFVKAVHQGSYTDAGTKMQAALAAGEAPVSWDDLKADAKALTGNGSYGYSCPLDQWYYMSLVMNAGGTIFNETEDGIGFAGDPGTKPLYLWKEMIADGTMHVPSGQDYNSSEACRNAFAGGTAAMIQQSSAQLKGLEKTCEFEVGVGAVPQDTTLSYPAGGSNLLMFKGHSEEEEKAGWEFLKYMTNTENAVRWANGTGYLPTRQSCIDSEEYKKMVEEDPNLQIIVDQVQ